jgi:hypothetical protein
MLILIGMLALLALLQNRLAAELAKFVAHSCFQAWIVALEKLAASSRRAISCMAKNRVGN